MAGKSFFSKHAYRFLAGDRETPPNSDACSVEFDEADVWNSHPQQQEFKKQMPSSRILKKSTKRVESGDRTAASSLPVNIPDWSKILREDCRDSRREFEGDSDGDEEEMRIPPHEFLAKQFAQTRIASYSVHEGIGRTLKGRDLSRVRNAIWEKTGFED
ncbi:protein S40-4-like [Magnolia sinica]|uniref:protein S40-4-like n=1 Tax=Magnolia sinica TaxID=86752 RepID=UPI002659E4E5|nr:protein S40-4-like [Magnolia sinica]